MVDLWEEMNKASREFQRNPNPKTKKKMQKAERAYKEYLAQNTVQPTDRP